MYKSNAKKKNGILNGDYDYNEPGSLELAYRVPENLIGEDLKNTCVKN